MQRKVHHKSAKSSVSISKGMEAYIFNKSEAELVIFSMMCELNKGELDIVEDNILYSGDSHGFIS
jgi:hypothetical protein